MTAPGPLVDSKSYTACCEYAYKCLIPDMQTIIDLAKNKRDKGVCVIISSLDNITQKTKMPIYHMTLDRILFKNPHIESHPIWPRLQEEVCSHDPATTVVVLFSIHLNNEAEYNLMAFKKR